VTFSTVRGFEQTLNPHVNNHKAQIKGQQRLFFSIKRV